MAIKFFFKPMAQSAAQLALDVYQGNKSKSEILNYAKSYFQNVMSLPVNPETLEISTDSDNKKTNVVKLGQIVIPKGVNLSTLTIESFFPGTNTLENIISSGHIPGYILTTPSAVFKNFTGNQYYQYFEMLQTTQIPVRLVISDCGVDMDVLVESIKKKYESCDEDIHYTLNLIQYKKHSATKLQTRKVKTSTGTVSKVIPTIKPRTKTGFSIGDTVIANGKYFYDSFGSKPFGTFNNFRGKISHITSNSKATNKYHITTMDGGWRGWVTSEQIQGVS